MDIEISYLSDKIIFQKKHTASLQSSTGVRHLTSAQQRSEPHVSYAIQRKTVQIHFCVCITQINSTYTPVSDLWKVSDISIFSISVWVVCVTPPLPPPSHDASVRIVMWPSMHPYMLFITDKTVIQLDLSPCNLNLKGETVRELTMLPIRTQVWLLTFYHYKCIMGKQNEHLLSLMSFQTCMTFFL